MQTALKCLGCFQMTTVQTCTLYQLLCLCTRYLLHIYASLKGDPSSSALAEVSSMTLSHKTFFWVEVCLYLIHSLRTFLIFHNRHICLFVVILCLLAKLCEYGTRNINMSYNTLSSSVDQQAFSTQVCSVIHADCC